MSLTLGIYFADEKGEIYSKRNITSKWSVSDEQRTPELHMMDEMANILTDKLKLEITPELLTEMINEIEEKINNE